MCVCVFVFVLVYVRVCIRVCVYVRACMCVCVLCIRVYICVSLVDDHMKMFQGKSAIFISICMSSSLHKRMLPGSYNSERSHMWNRTFPVERRKSHFSYP